MATRLYLRTDSAAEPKPNVNQSTYSLSQSVVMTYGGGQDGNTGAGAACYPCIMSTVAGSSNVEATSNQSEVGIGHYLKIKTFVSPALAAQTLSTTGTFALVYDMNEGNVAHNMYPLPNLFVWASDDSGKRGSNLYVQTATVEADTTIATLQTATFASYAIQNNVTVSDGDVLVLELYTRDDNTKTAAYAHGLGFNGAAGSNYETYMELSQTVTWKSTTVSRTSAHLYHLRTSISRISAQLYHLRNLITRTNTQLYNIKNSIETKLTDIYHILGAIQVENVFIALYDVNEFAAATKTILYDIRNYVARATSQRYNINALISRTHRGIYNIRESIFASWATSYRVLASIAKTLTSFYHIREYVTRGHTALYNMRNSIGALWRTGYNMAGKALIVLLSIYHIRTSVSKEDGFIYNIKTGISSVKTFIYNVGGLVTKTATFMYHIGGVLASVLRAKYNIRVLVDNKTVQIYDVKNLADRTIFALYTIGGMVYKKLTAAYKIEATWTRQIILMKEALARYYRVKLLRAVHGFESTSLKLTDVNVTGMTFAPKKRKQTLYGASVTIQFRFKSGDDWEEENQ